MLSGEGNKNGEKKTTIGLISRKSTLHEHHPFFVHFFAVVLHDYSVKLPETSRNFQKLPSYTFYGGNVTRVRVQFFSTVAHFHPGGC